MNPDATRTPANPSIMNPHIPESAPRALPLRAAGAALLSLGVLAACAPGTPAPATPSPASAEATIDRSVMPPPGTTPSFDLPEVERRTLSNGMEVYVVERRELPLVTLQMVVGAGAAAEPAGRAGLASLTAAMLDEGTDERSALEIADELDFLAANVYTGAGTDAAYLVLNTLRRNLEPALDVFADVVTDPAFPASEAERVRNERLTAIVEASDRPTTVANQQFNLRIYGPDHPYGRPIEGTTASVRALGPEQLRDFYRTFYRPNNADLIVVGDVSAEQIVPMLEQAFAGWEQAPVPAVRYPAPPAPQEATRVFLIDKPGAAQSEIRIGHVGVPRDNPDYFPLMVMNSILGGQFSSRINLNLREDKGYTYGARSAFNMLREPGTFVASAGVQTPSTKESVVEFMKELREIRAERPVTDEEVEFAKQSIILAQPRQTETNDQVASRLEDLILYSLPTDYFDSYDQRVAAVTREEVERVAREYLDPEHFAVVIVGDRSVVEAGLRELPYPVEVVEVERPAAVSGR